MPGSSQNLNTLANDRVSASALGSGTTVSQTEIPKIIRQRSRSLMDKSLSLGLSSSLQDMRNKYLQDSEDLVSFNLNSNTNNANNVSRPANGYGNGTKGVGSSNASKRVSMFPDFESTRHRSNTLNTSDSINSYYSSSINENSDGYYSQDDDFIYNSGSGSGSRIDLNQQKSNQNQQRPAWRLTDILQELGDKDKGPKDLVLVANEFVDLLQNNDGLKQEIVLSSLGHRVQTLLINPSSDVVAAGYRILRYIITDYDSLTFLADLDIDYCLICSLTRDSKSTSLSEREQALKLVRKYIEIENGLYQLSVGCVRTIVSIAESQDDLLRVIALETVVEISLLRPELAFQANGIRCFLNAILDYPLHIASFCITPIIKLLELPTTRPYILDESIVESLIVPFMDSSHVKEEKLEVCAFIITIFLKSWPGLLAFSMNKFRALKQLIECLSFDSKVLKSVVIYIFLDVFRITPLPWVEIPSNLDESPYFSFSEFSLNLPASRKSRLSHRSMPQKESSFINHHTAILLQACLNCGIADELKNLLENTKDRPMRKAIILFSEISYLRSYFIPPGLTATIDPPFALSSRMEKELRNHHSGTNIIRANKITSLEGNSKTMKMSSYSTDEDELKRMIINTGVLTSKEYSTWDLNLIIELFQGPLRDPKRLDDADRRKFFKRLMSFYRPFKRRFAEKNKSRNNQSYIKVGCELFKCLLASDTGVRYLNENKILPQIADCLAQVAPFSGITANNPVFSKHNLENTLCYGYFSFLGVLSADSNGIKMLERWSVFDMLYRLSDKSANRDDIVKLILNEMSYENPGHMRIILCKAASISNIPIRIVATNILGSLLEKKECEDFAVYNLINQLCDPNVEICNLAVVLLTKYANDERTIYKVIKYRPPISLLGKAGNSLMLSMLSTVAGYQFFQEINYVEAEMELWLDTKNKEYVRDIETFILDSLYQAKSSSFNSNDNNLETPILPYHFFGALVKTPQGLELLDSSGTFSSFANVISFYASILDTGDEFSFYSNHSKEEQEETLLELKSSIWAIGHIGSSEYGICLLELSGTVDQIVSICENSNNWALKGTCFYAMGLIANTNQGWEILDDLGWASMTTPLGQPLGICVPKLTENFYPSIDPLIIDTAELKIPTDSSTEIFDQIIFEFFPSLPDSQIPKVPSSVLEVLNGVYQNLVLLPADPKKACSNLKEIRNNSPQLFESEPALLKMVMTFIEKFKFKSSARKFLLTEFLDFNKLTEALFKRNRKKIKDKVQVASSTQAMLQTPSSKVSLDKLVHSHSYQRTYSQVSKQVQLQLQDQLNEPKDMYEDSFIKEQFNTTDSFQHQEPTRSSSMLKRKPPPAP